MNYVLLDDQDVNMGQLSILSRFIPQTLSILPRAISRMAPSDPVAETKRYLLSQLIDRFNFAYIGHDTAANYSTMLKWYKMIMENYADILTAAQAKALPIKLDAKRRRVAAAPGVFDPIVSAPVTYPGIEKIPVTVAAPGIPGLPPTVTIGTWRVPTTTLMIAGGGVAALLLVIALTRKPKPRRRYA